MSLYSILLSVSYYPGPKTFSVNWTGEFSCSNIRRLGLYRFGTKPRYGYQLVSPSARRGIPRFLRMHPWHGRFTTLRSTNQSLPGVESSFLSFNLVDPCASSPALQLQLQVLLSSPGLCSGLFMCGNYANGHRLDTISRLQVISPVAGTVCHGGQPCLAQWLDDGQAPLLTAMGPCHVALYAGNEVRSTPVASFNGTDIA